MKTIIYLIRHSETFKEHRGIENTNETILEKNIKTPLSINGEKLAEKISFNDEFKDLDIVWSSSYIRAMSTAKYFADRNNIKVNIDVRLGERIHGCINSYDELPDDFENKQLLDKKFKINNGENQLDVRNRMYEFLKEILEQNSGKKIAIIGHSSAFIFLLLKWCDFKLEDNINLIFKNNIIFNKKVGYCETFKLIFQNSELKSIESIEVN